MLYRIMVIAMGFLSGFSQAAELQNNAEAPDFSAQTQSGKDFSLSSRKGHWTVLYFYPKADTPGCTKQACAFRDNIQKIRAEGAEVFGISSDSVDALAKFHAKHKLSFDLLADPEGKVIEAYGTKMPLVNISKRWTFVLDPDLKIRVIAKGVDPVVDSEKIASQIAKLKSEK